MTSRGFEISQTQPISGGDIHEAFLLEGKKGRFFLKMNLQKEALDMFRTEAMGLKLLASTQTIAIPKVIEVNGIDGHAFLLLPYIEPSAPTPSFWSSFGQALAELHRNSHQNFGLDHDNYIGRLPQSNRQHDNWLSFYREERLAPQLSMAVDQHLMDKDDQLAFDRLYQQIKNICPPEPPALIHGDLWSGNFLCDQKQQAFLIDPACCYAHREMDLAMSRLFGGFAPAFYEAYQHYYPLERGFEGRISIYQLYYLMAHVNMFGQSYLPAVRRILKQYH